MKNYFIGLLILMQFSGCGDNSIKGEPTFNYVTSIKIGDILHQVRYRVDDANGKKLISPVFVFPDIEPTQGWTISFDYEKGYFYIRGSGREIKQTSCPISYLSPDEKDNCLGWDLETILGELKAKNLSVLEIVFPAVEEYLNEKAEPVAGGDATR